MKQITQEFAREYLRYEPDTGSLYWTKKASDKTVVGKKAGWQRSKNGYRQVGFMGQIIYEHRLIWLFVNGSFPDGQIDHKNGVKDDNRYENLRHATSSQNLVNIGAKRDNTSGAKNVHWCNRSSKWIAKAKIYGKTHYAGSFDCFQAAVIAAAAVRDKVHGEFAHRASCDAAMVAWQYRNAAL
jgi:hypothetical protein